MGRAATFNLGSRSTNRVARSSVRVDSVMGSVSGARAEENRIRDAYARRQRNVSPERYSPFSIANLLRVHEVERSLLGLLRKHGHTKLESHKILEIGCGSGYWLRKFIEWGARPENLFGIDLIHDRIAQARQLLPPRATLECADAAKLSFLDETFDIVCQFTVFTSVLDRGLQTRIASEMLRVQRDNGLILWYDFCVNNPWNPDVKAVTKRQMRSLFAGSRLDLRRITLAPPLARPIGRLSPLLYQVASSTKVFCTHYAGVIEK
jgi:SAM-dependent methyltransferase